MFKCRDMLSSFLQGVVLMSLQLIVCVLFCRIFCVKLNYLQNTVTTLVIVA